MKSTEDNLLEKHFPGALVPGTLVPFMHKGEWAIHQVLPILLSRTGSAHVSIATFNVSEESLRTLFFMSQERQLLSLRLLLDMNVRRHKLPLLLFAGGITPTVRLDSCHAKVCLVRSTSHSFGIVGSANLNWNHRWESGFYFTEGDCFDYFEKKFNLAFGQALEYGIYEGDTGED